MCYKSYLILMLRSSRRFHQFRPYLRINLSNIMHEVRHNANPKRGGVATASDGGGPYAHSLFLGKNYDVMLKY